MMVLPQGNEGPWGLSLPVGSHLASFMSVVIPSQMTGRSPCHPWNPHVFPGPFYLEPHCSALSLLRMLIFYSVQIIGITFDF